MVCNLEYLGVLGIIGLWVIIYIVHSGAALLIYEWEAFSKLRCLPSIYNVVIMVFIWWVPFYFCCFYFIFRSLPLLLPAVEDGIFNDSWRIRQSSVELLGDLLFKVFHLNLFLFPSLGVSKSLVSEIIFINPGCWDFWKSFTWGWQWWWRC